MRLMYHLVFFFRMRFLHIHLVFDQHLLYLFQPQVHQRTFYLVIVVVLFRHGVNRQLNLFIDSSHAFEIIPAQLKKF